MGDIIVSVRIIHRSEQIKNREQEYPDQVNKVPEQTGNFNTVGKPLRVLLPHPAARPPQEANDDGAANDVQRMQTGKRKINCGVSVMPRTVAARLLDFRL